MTKVSWEIYIKYVKENQSSKFLKKGVTTTEKKFFLHFTLFNYYRGFVCTFLMQSKERKIDKFNTQTSLSVCITYYHHYWKFNHSRWKFLEIVSLFFTSLKASLNLLYLQLLLLLYESTLKFLINNNILYHHFCFCLSEKAFIFTSF